MSGLPGLLDDLLDLDDDRDQTPPRPSNMAQNGNGNGNGNNGAGDQLPPQEGPIAPSQSQAQTTQQQQQPTQQPTSSQQQQQQPPPSSSASPSATTASPDPPPPSSSAPPPSSSAAPPPSSSSTAAPTSNEAAPSTISLPSSTTQTTRTVVVTASGAASVPGLLSVSASASGTTAADLSKGKGGVGGSGLPLGAVVGIVIGGLVVIAIIAILATRTVRKRARARRTAHRSSMFEPWPAPVALEDEPYEKPTYAEPAQSYPMQDTTQDYNDGTYPGYADNGAYPPMAGTMPGYDQYGAQPYGAAPYEAGAAGMGAGAGAVAGVAGAVASGPGAEAGLQDNMMVRVKVGFVRSLEDELAITAGQQLYLHTSYDDGWCLCEDQAQNRGVVPISCLEPWDENAQGLAPGSSDPVTNMSARRSSLYQVSPAPNYD